MNLWRPHGCARERGTKFRLNVAGARFIYSSGLIGWSITPGWGEMKNIRIDFVMAAMLFLFLGGVAVAQPRSGRPAPVPCQVSGAYRIDVAESDKLYSVVRGATSTVPFGDQQRFFMDLSVRLTPPDLLAIECRGSEVSVGSSRAPKATYIADGKTHQERTPSGNTVYSRVALDRDTLTFTSNGKAEDNIRVSFRSVDGGRRLRVTRSIYAEQLTQPIVIQSVYDKIADTVDWGTYHDQQVARQAPDIDNPPTTAVNASPARSTAPGRDQAIVLRRALNDWIAATNKRDIDKQISFYKPTLKAFYLTRNTTRSAVRLEKQRAFQAARSVNISAEEPEIVLQDGGRTAVMRFRKQYRIAEKNRTRSGEVVQELRWQKTGTGWRIFSERDVRVIR